MAINAPTGGNFIQQHETVFLGGIVVVVLVVGGMLLSKKQTVTGTGVTPDTSGLTNGDLVYVPTQTSFTTNNTGADYSGDPNLTSISNSPVSSNSPVVNQPVTTTTTTTGSPIVVSSPPKQTTPPGPVGSKPVGTPITKPPAHSTPVKHYQLVWGARHTVEPGDTLSYIVSQSNMIMHTQQHMPASVSYTVSDLRAHNHGVSDPPKVGSTIILPSWENA